MQKLVKNYLDELNKRHKRNRRAAVALLLLAVLVIGGVLSTLSQYGVALEEPEKKPLCGLEEHTHTDACYEEVLICGHGEGAEEDAEAEPVAQEPTAQEPAERVLTCGQEESEGHTHSGDCYTVEETLICGQEESEGHTHGEGCYGEDGQLICGQEESEGHTHTGDCYEVKETLTCGQEESEGHTHTDACYTETVPEEVAPEETTKQESPAETEEEHIHTDACYERRLICGLEEHTHTEACYVDGAADVETASDWEQMFADVEWKEEWGQDLVTAAQMQIGYQESKTNYQSDEDGAHKGYTRYGAFMEDPYMDWNAAFVNFCLHYAGLNEEDVFPEDMNAGEWYQTFVEADENNADYITPAEEYEPKAGDIVFLEDEENGDTLMGIVSSYDEETGEAKVIVGDDGDEVTEETYVIKGEAADESPISSYLMTTELEDHIKNNIRIMKAEGEDYTVTVRFTDAAEIPEDAVLNVREIEEGTDEYQTHYEQSLEAMGAQELSFARYFDITFLVNDEKIEPKDTVNVTITYADSIEVNEDDKLGAVHFKNDGEIEVLDVESNLKGDAAAVSEEEAGSGQEEETTGTFFRFEQNSFSTSGTVAALSAADNTRANGTEYTFYKWSEIDSNTKFDGKIVLLTSSGRLMTGTPNANATAIKGISVSTNENTLSAVRSNAWSFEESGNGYKLYNIGSNADEKKYLKIADTLIDSRQKKLELVEDKNSASELKVEIDNNQVVIYADIDGEKYRLNKSGNGDEGFIAWAEGSSATDNEKFTLFKLQKTVVLNPYNISNVETQNSPYRFVVDGVGGNNPGRLPLTVDISKEDLEKENPTANIILPDNNTRTTGFDISSLDGSGNHYILDSEGYKWKLKGWYNIADKKYYPGENGSMEAVISLEPNVYDVFYADWEAATYDNGKTQAGVVETADTSSFVKTELFDYNELVNITLNNADGTFGKKLDKTKTTANGEYWEEATDKGVAFGNWVLKGNNNNGLGNLGASYKTDGTSDLSNEITDRNDVDKIISTLFDFETLPMGVTSVGTAEGLYKKDLNGYYEYNSDSNAASYSQGKFYVYENPQKIGEKTAFLPFNGEDNYSQSDGTVNYWFGMKTEINYWLNDNSGSAGNNCINGESMIFEFTGDDDVWVFDETPGGKKELLLNLSSCHGPWSGTIDFSTGKVTKAKSEKITDSNAVIKDFHGQLKSGQHKLTVYYLERGAGDSNCKIRFNLVPAWEYEGEPLQKITVNKKWVGENETATLSDAVIEKETISVSLYESDAQGNKETGAAAEETVTLSAANNWTHTWYRPKDKNYTVVEEETEDDSYIMVKSERDANGYWGSWIENSNLSEGDKIVIGNGKGGDAGKVLAVNADGTIGIAQRDVIVLNTENTSDVLRNEDVDAIENGGIPLNQQWIVHIVNSVEGEKGYIQFQLQSASTDKYLNIKTPSSPLLVDDIDENSQVSTLYFSDGQLTGTSKNQLVVDGDGFKVVSRQSDTSRSLNDNRVHLYKYFPEDEKGSPLTNVTITNKPLTAKLQIRKVDRASESKVLGSVEFKLFRVEKDANGITEMPYPNEATPLVIKTGDSGDDLGIAKIDSLPVGTYYLRETKAPAGYALLAEPIVITVSKNINENPAEGEAKVSVKVDVDFNMDVWSNEQYLTYDAGTGTFTIVVPNVLLYELPSTGGIGTYWYTIGGTLLLMAAALVLYKRKYAGR